MTTYCTHGMASAHHPIDGAACLGPVPTQGDLLAELAIADVEANADTNWLASATDALNVLVRAGRPFTTDDVWEALDARQVPPPREPRAMGAVTRAASRQQRIVNTQQYVKSNRPGCHSRPIPVWRPTA